MSKQQPSSAPAAAKPPRDYKKTLSQLKLLESHLMDERSPMAAAMNAYLKPYGEQVLAGKLKPDDYTKLGGKFVNQWADKNLFEGQGLPTDEDMRGPILQEELAQRAQIQAQIAAEPGRKPGAAGVETPDESNPYGPLKRQAGALARLLALDPQPEVPPQPQQPTQMPVAMPRQPQSSKLAAAMKSGGMSPQRVQASAGGSEDGMLGESQLMMLQQLADPQNSFYETEDALGPKAIEGDPDAAHLDFRRKQSR